MKQSEIFILEMESLQRTWQLTVNTQKVVVESDIGLIGKAESEDRTNINIKMRHIWAQGKEQFLNMAAQNSSGSQ